MAENNDNVSADAGEGAKDSGVGKDAGDGSSRWERVRDIGDQAVLVGKRGLVGGVRAVLPLVEGYARSLETSDTGEQPGGIPQGDELSFSDEEMKVLSTAGTKLAYELIELSSQQYPISEDAVPYKAEFDPQTERYPAPTLTHLLSVVQAARGLFPTDETKQAQSAVQGTADFSSADAAGELPTINAANPAPAELVTMRRGSATPLEIRRNAKSQRYLSLNHQEGTTVMSTRQLKQVQSKSMRSYEGAGNVTMVRDTDAAYPCCRSPTSAATTGMARYDENGECASLFTISCETQWRLRNCFKEMFCDILYCAGDHVGEDGSIGDIGDALGDCFNTALVSLVRCLPDAVCGPRGPAACEPKRSIECGFAVEEIE